MMREEPQLLMRSLLTYSLEDWLRAYLYGQIECCGVLEWEIELFAAGADRFA
jgi:hypothetical protein